MRTIYVSRQTAARWQSEAVANGYAGQFRREGSCTDPSLCYVKGRPDPVVDRREQPTANGTTSAGKHFPPDVVGVGYFKCGRCPPCLRRRAVKWVARGTVELTFAPRTWFITLTLSPEEQFMCLIRAQRAAIGAAGVPIEDLPADEQFKLRANEAGKLVTLWLKRLRHYGPFRYLLVVEPHEGGGAHHGLPHFHLLLHEQGKEIGNRDIEGEWRSGISHARLVDLEVKPASEWAWYVCKYLTKSVLARIRASTRYGQLAQLVYLKDQASKKPDATLLKENKECKSMSEPPEEL